MYASKQDNETWGGGKERETNEPEGKHRRGDEETQIGVTEERNKTSP